MLPIESLNFGYAEELKDGQIAYSTIHDNCLLIVVGEGKDKEVIFSFEYEPETADAS